MTLAFSHLGLRRNPFGALDEPESAALAVADVDRLMAWLDPDGGQS